MKILIIGTGAIGTFVGGALSHGGNELTFLDMEPVVERIKREGLRVEGITKEEIVLKNVNAVSRLTEGDLFDLAILSVKAYDTLSVVGTLSGENFKRILTFQNGIGNEETLAEKFGYEKVIAGSITYPVSYPRPGVVKIENPKAGMGISPVKVDEDINDILDILKKSSLNVELFSCYKGMKWSKLLLNIVCNASCAILGMTPGEIFNDRKLVKIEREQFNEGVRVANAMGLELVDLPGYPVHLLKNLYGITPPSILKFLLKGKMQKARGDKKPSLLIEAERGTGKTEVGWLNGKIAEYGEKAGIPTPVNMVLNRVLIGITRGEILKEDFYKKPSSLLNRLGDF